MFAGARRWTLLLGIALLARQGIVLGQQTPPAMPSVQNIPAAVAPDLATRPEVQFVSAAAVDEKASLEARVAELEKAMKQAEEKEAGARYTLVDQPTISGTSPIATPPVISTKDGIVFHNADDSLVLRVTGQIQTDYRGFLNNTDQTDIDEFLLRRARLGIEATILKYYEFRLLPDFAGNSGSTIITDAYMNIHYVDEIQLEVGKFKQPMSYEQLIQDRYVPVMERSMIDQLVPARDVGAMIHGRNLIDGRLDYGVAISNGEINGNAEPSFAAAGTEHNDKDLNARIAIRPFGGPEGDDLLRHLQFGISGGWGVDDQVISSTDLSTPSILKTPATVEWFAYRSAVTADGLRTRLSPELVYFYHSLGFAAQYYREQQKLAPTAGGVQTVDTDGFYVMGSYLLTGEQRTEYSQQIEPICPFNPSCPGCSPGAWELVFRVSRLDMDKGVLGTAATTTLADSTRFSSGATETTFGVNWYLNKWVRTQLNWEHAWFDDPVAPLAGTPGTASNPYYSHQDTLYARAQIIF